ncbi:MAG: Chemotaxis protein CheY [Saprospiraceae bacterium]|nr:Chemotaxis protein CheY [Saprospiraceae bacterium]
MNRKILLVEDHDSLRQVIGAFLSNCFDVTGAKNGLEAMSHLSRGFVPDVIVTDAMMPGLNGFQFLANLRCSGLYANIPVVVISGSCNDEEAARFQQLGVRAYFRKPFNPVQLQERLAQITGQ